MAEVVEYWPERRATSMREYFYPWDQWTALDEKGHGDIWVAHQGIDYPSYMAPGAFRSILWSRLNSIRAKRKRDEKMVLKRVRLKSTGEETMRRVSNYRHMRIKVVVVTEESVAFQFYDSKTEPPEPPVPAKHTRTQRNPLFEYKNRRVLERRERTENELLKPNPRRGRARATESRPRSRS